MNRVVLITGAGGGLGQGLTGEFARQGWQVVAASRRPNPAAASDQVFPMVLDPTQAGAVEEALTGCSKKFGRLDVLINNAGANADSLCAQMSEEDWDLALGVNLRSAFLCSRTASRLMMRQRDGHILNISSYAGRAGARGQANYAAAKAGLIGLTQSLAKELGSRNVRVNAILPGVMPTPMTAHFNEERLESFRSANALGRINSVEEVARFIVFLAGTRNISGQVFQLDSRIAPWT